MTKNKLKQLPHKRVYEWIVDNFDLSFEQMSEVDEMDEIELLDFALTLCD